MADRANASQGRGRQGVQGNALDGRRDESRVRQVQVIVTSRDNLLGRGRCNNGELARQGVFVQEVVPRESRGKVIEDVINFYFKDQDAPEGKVWHYMIAMKNDANLVYLMDLLDNECIAGVAAIIIAEMLAIV